MHRYALLATAAALLAQTCESRAQLVPPGGPEPAPRQDEILQFTTPEITVKALEAAGYRNAEVYATQRGRHAQGMCNQLRVGVLHYPVGQAEAKHIQFFVRFGKQPQIDDNWMQSWNANYLFARYYRDADSEIFATFEQIVAGGVTRQNIVNVAKNFCSTVVGSTSYRPPPRAPSGPLTPR